MHGVPGAVTAVRPRVLVRPDVHRFLDAEAGSCAGRPEAGGTLLGSRRGPDLEVLGWTVPGPGDDRRLHAFTRADPRHQAAATAAWNASGGTVTFVGEWHTHPTGGVAPSAADLRSWRRLAGANGLPMAFALVAPGVWGLFLAKPRLLWLAVTRQAPIERSDLGVVFA